MLIVAWLNKNLLIDRLITGFQHFW